MERLRAAFAGRPEILVALVLGLRNVSDLVSGIAILGPVRLNLSSLIGVGIIAAAIAMLARRQARFGTRAAAIVVAFLTTWLVVGFAVHGFDASLIREWFRLLSVVALGLVVANLVDVSPRQCAAAVAAAMVVPVTAALIQVLVNAGHIGPQGSAEFFRASGTFVQANKAAQSFLLAAALALWAIVDYGPRVATLLYELASSGALLATRSLGGLGAAAASALSFLLLRPTNGRVRLAIAGGVVLLAIIFAVSPFGSSRIGALPHTRLPWDIVGRTNNSLEWRLYNWWHLLAAWRMQPILGHGLGSTIQLVRPIDFVTHSDLLKFIVEGGIVGASFAIGLIGWAFTATTHAVRGGPVRDRLLATVMLSVLIGLGLQSFAQNTSANTALLYMLVVLLVPLWRPGRDNARRLGAVPA
jgi:O-antigen ligase